MRSLQRWHIAFLALVAIVLIALLIDRGGVAAGTPAPEIQGGPWFNSAPKTMAELRGRVVLVEFWTFGCFNCRNVAPHVREWHRRHADRGLTVIGVHTPETAFEKDPENVRRFLAEEGIDYPIVVDGEFATWNAYRNRAWPAWYLVDKQGVIRWSHIGEGAYEETAKRIEELIAER